MKWLKKFFSSPDSFPEPPEPPPAPPKPISCRFNEVAENISLASQMGVKGGHFDNLYSYTETVTTFKPRKKHRLIRKKRSKGWSSLSARHTHMQIIKLRRDLGI